MTSDPEPSYYEISLTSRQVLVAFVLLLGCVVVAFFAGIWAAHRAEGPEVAAAREVRPEESRIAELEGEELGELRFFSDEPIAAAAEPAAAKTTGESVAKASPTPEPALAAPEPRSRPAERDSAAGPEKPPGTTPKSSQEPPQGSGPVIQVFSSNDRVQAEKLVDRLREGNYPAFLLAEEVRGQTMYRVRIGPYEEREVAERVAEAVRAGFRLDTWITTQ